MRWIAAHPVVYYVLAVVAAFVAFVLVVVHPLFLLLCVVILAGMVPIHLRARKVTARASRPARELQSAGDDRALPARSDSGSSVSLPARPEADPQPTQLDTVRNSEPPSANDAPAPLVAPQPEPRPTDAAATPATHADSSGSSAPARPEASSAPGIPTVSVVPLSDSHPTDTAATPAPHVESSALERRETPSPRLVSIETPEDDRRVARRAAQEDRRVARRVAQEARREAREARRAAKERQKAFAQWQAEQAPYDVAVGFARRLVTREGVPSGAMLRPTEVAVWSGEAGLVSPQRTPGHYVGASTGTSFHVAKGVTFRVGASRGTFIRGEEVQAVTDHGTVTVTNTRVIFRGATTTREWAHSKVLGMDHTEDGRTVLIHVSNRQKVSGVKTTSADFAVALAVCLEALNATPAGVLEQVEAAAEEHRQLQPATE